MEALGVIVLLVMGLVAMQIAITRSEAQSPPEGRVVHLRPAPRFDRPDDVTEPIGRYMGGPIHRSIFLEGREYFFDRVAPHPETVLLASDERCIAPGIVYRA